MICSLMKYSTCISGSPIAAAFLLGLLFCSVPTKKVGATDQLDSTGSKANANSWICKDIEGELCSLRSGDEQQLTVVVFVSTDCPVANAFQPALRAIQSTYSDEDVRFFQVHPTPRTSEEKARKHKSDFQIKSRVILDPQRKIAKLLEAKVTPEAFLLDAEGNVLYRGRINDLYVGFGKKRRKPQTHDLASAVEHALAGEEIETKETQAIGCLIPQD